MTREIKFRAWEKIGQQIIGWQQWVDNSINLYEILGNGEFIVMQYTGLTDKNGKEIYEQDIVKFGKKSLGNNQRDEDYNTLPIVWSATRGAWVFDDGDRDYYRSWNAYIYSDLEVIGNTWENPELLENENKELLP